MKNTCSILFPSIVMVTATLCGKGDEKPLRLSEIDPDGKIKWVEIVNTADREEPLDGYLLFVERVDSSDTEKASRRFDFPPGLKLPARRSPQGAFFVVCYGGFPVRTPEGEKKPDCKDPAPSCGSDASGERICIPFALDPDGGVVSLRWKPPCEVVPSRLVDSVVYPPLPEDTSFGRAEDGEWCVLEVKTPGAENAEVPAAPPPCAPSLGRVVINEVSTSGADWIELYLTGEAPEPVLLSQYVLESHGAELRLSLPPQVAVLAGGGGAGDPCGARRVVLVLDDLPPPGACPPRTTKIQAPFRLSEAGESLVLRSLDGADSDRLVIPALAPGEIFARIPDGGPPTVTRTATPTGPNPAQRENLPPSVEVIDRFPLKVVPGDDVQVYAKVIDRDGQDTLGPVTLSWEAPGAGPEPPVRRSAVMGPGKRVTCQRVEEPGIFTAVVPAGTLPGAGTELSFQVSAKDDAGSVTESEWIGVFVQPVEWTDPGDAHLLRVNEVSANEPNQFGDWVEIFNASAAQTVYLGGMFLTEDVFRIEGRRLDPGNGDLFILPRSFLRVSLTSAPEAPKPSLSFRLDNCRDEVILIHRDRKTVIDTISFHEEKVGKTLGRLPDGGPDVAIMEASPGKPNRSSSCFDVMRRPPGATLVINEVTGDNWASFHDAGNEYGDWIEIFNRGSEPQSLDCWSLADSWLLDPFRGKPQEPWYFPNGVTVPPGSFLVVWCDSDSDCETLETRGELHTDFQLNRLEDFVQLLDPCGQVADYVQFKYQPRDVTVGRFPDGEGEGSFLEPTPGKPNAELPPGRVQLPAASCVTLPRELTLGAGPCSVACVSFRRGDGDGNCRVDITDAIFTLGFLFQGRQGPPCPDAADANDDGKVDISDAIYALGFLFLGSAAPPAPGPEEPGPDPTQDDLSPCQETGCQP